MESKFPYCFPLDKSHSKCKKLTVRICHLILKTKLFTATAAIFSVEMYRRDLGHASYQAFLTRLLLQRRESQTRY
jgi:hypothetical protein